jgi:protein-L-isoaspartate O-methyltransferase
MRLHAAAVRYSAVTDQLAIGGRLVGPHGEDKALQRLVRDSQGPSDHQRKNCAMCSLCH